MAGTKITHHGDGKRTRETTYGDGSKRVVKSQHSFGGVKITSEQNIRPPKKR